jgi:hypothetical protein
LVGAGIRETIWNPDETEDEKKRRLKNEQMAKEAFKYFGLGFDSGGFVVNAPLTFGPSAPENTPYSRMVEEQKEELDKLRATEEGRQSLYADPFGSEVKYGHAMGQYHSALNLMEQLDAIDKVRGNDDYYTRHNKPFGKKSEFIKSVLLGNEQLTKEQRSGIAALQKDAGLMYAGIKAQAALKQRATGLNATTEASFATSDPGLFDQYMALFKSGNVEGANKILESWRAKTKYNPYIESKREALGEKTAQEQYETAKKFREVLKTMGTKPDKRANGGSLPVKHGGGMIAQSGPIFAEKGEIILPKKYADGGVAENSLMTATLTGGSQSEAPGWVKEFIKELSSVELKVNTEGVTVGVNTEGAFVDVKTEGVAVPIDTAGLGDFVSSISDSVKTAVESAQINVTGGAVGADEINKLNELIENVQNKVLVVSGDLEGMKTTVLDLENNSITQENIRTQVGAVVSDAMSSVRSDIDSYRNEISQTQSKISRLENTYDSKFDEQRRLAAQAHDLSNRT